MTRCPSCSSAVSDVAVACPECGKPLDPAGNLPTLEAPARSPAATPPQTPSHPPTPSGYGEAGFAPGHVFAERYRIVGLLGRGGMGEVYRADDLKLGNPVALKFLSRKLSGDPNLVQRFYAEVRLARQVAHPNVCRVYDVGESDGLLYLSMEYVDGEDLASLLKRIGRLPPDKALDIARELCAGLAAAHDRGVVHRDLKPANVMLDGRGHARITDFGLAIPLETGAERGYAGTPAYMAPEQLTGGDITQKTDLYALGLIFYEIFTGKRAYEAKSIRERLRELDTARPESVTGIAGTDPAVERAIMRCLEKEPSKRPASALAVAAALPGGDPLAAALAAGETPSPEMVAAAGGESAVPLGTAWMLLGGVLLLMAGVIAVSPYSTDIGLGAWQKDPAVLRQHAREIASQFGYAGDPADSVTWLERDYVALRYVADHVPAPGWRRIYSDLGPPILFNYRQSPRPLVAFGDRVTFSNPALEIPGMVNVVTDTQGRLRRFRAVPAQMEESPPAAGAFNWAPLFTKAGLDPARFERQEPTWVPPSAFDAHAEWTGSMPELPGVPLTVSAAAFRGRLVHFELLGPWSQPEWVSALAARSQASFRDTRIITALVFLSLLLSGVFLARNNLRQGRGDRKGAARLAQFMFAAAFLQWALTAHHAGDPGSWILNNFLDAVGNAFFIGAFFWLLYMALEPYFRRRLPELLISWARLLEGRTRDPRVGRDILTGALAGTSLALLSHAVNALPTWFALQGQTTIALALRFNPSIMGPSSFEYLSAVHVAAFGMAFVPIGIYFVLRLALRKPLLAAAGLGVVEILLNLGRENLQLELPSAVLTAAVIVLVATRFGLLALISMRYFDLLLSSVAPSFDFSSWYAAYSMPGLVLLVALALYAFRISIGEQRIFGSALLEEEA